MRSCRIVKHVIHQRNTEAVRYVYGIHAVTSHARIVNEYVVFDFTRHGGRRRVDFDHTSACVVLESVSSHLKKTRFTELGKDENVCVGSLNYIFAKF